MKSTQPFDGVVLSHPKTGRTWLRFQLATYIGFLLDSGIRVDLHNIYSLVPNADTSVHGRGIEDIDPLVRDGVAPRIAMCHELIPIDRLRSSELANRFAILIRSPFDTVVSHWYHAKHHYQNDIGTLTSFVRSETSGIASIISFCEHFQNALALPQVALLSYEEMSRSPHSALTSIVRHFGIPYDSVAVGLAVKASEFGEMQRIELARGMKGIDYDRTNPAALRVRRGEVGTALQELSEEDIVYIRASIRKSPSTRAVYEAVNLDVLS